MKVLEKKCKMNPGLVYNWVLKLMNTYNYYALNCNKLEKKLWELNKINAGLELK